MPPGPCRSAPPGRPSPAAESDPHASTPRARGSPTGSRLAPCTPVPAAPADPRPTAAALSCRIPAPRCCRQRSAPSASPSSPRAAPSSPTCTPPACRTSTPIPRSCACFPLAFSCEQRWGRRRAGAPSVGERTDSARRTQLRDEVREAERAPWMVSQGGDGGTDPLEGLGAERPLDLLEVAFLRLPLARTALPGRIPEIIEMREPFGARDRGPLASVEPYARACRAPVEVERMRGLYPRPHQQPAAPGTEAGDLVGAGRRGFCVQRRGNDMLVDRTVRQPDAATTRTPRGRHGVRVGDAVLGEGGERLRLALRTRSHGQERRRSPRCVSSARCGRMEGRCVPGPGERPTAL